MGCKDCKCENCNCGGNSCIPYDEPVTGTRYMFNGGKKVPTEVPSCGSKVFINARQCGKTGSQTEIIKNQSKIKVIAVMSRWEFKCTMSYVGVTETVDNADELGFVCVRPPEYNAHSECVTAKPFYISIINYKNQSIVGKAKGVKWEPLTFEFNIAHELMTRGYSVKCSGDEFGTFYNYGRKEIKVNSEKATGATGDSLVDATEIIIETSKENPYVTEENMKIVKREIDGFSTKQIRGKWELV